MNENDSIRQLRKLQPHIPDPESLRRSVLHRIREEIQTVPMCIGWLERITDVLARKRLRYSLAVTTALLLTVCTVQFYDLAQSVAQLEQRYQLRQTVQPGIEAVYAADRYDLPGVSGNALDVLRNAGLNAVAMNGYVAVRKSDLSPLRTQLFLHSLRRLRSTDVAGVKPGELPSLLDELRARVFLSLRFPV